jgi:hypothetical protein
MLFLAYCCIFLVNLVLENQLGHHFKEQICVFLVYLVLEYQLGNLFDEQICVF